MTNAELIKALRCCVTDYNNIQSRLCNKCQYAKYADGKYGCENKLKVDAADAIEKLQAMIDANKWISVDEALPEVGDVVLAMGKRHATTGQFQGIGSKPCYWWWKGRTVKEVTHWMPLPQPPNCGAKMKGANDED